MGIKYFQLIKKLVFLMGILVSLLFVFISFHSYFVLKKADFTFFITTLVFFSVCLIIFLLALLDKIKISTKSFYQQSKFTNVMIGACSIVLSLSIAYYVWMRRGFGNLNDIFGISLFLIGGLAILIKNFKKK